MTWRRATQLHGLSHTYGGADVVRPVRAWGRLCGCGFGFVVVPKLERVAFRGMHPVAVHIPRIIAAVQAADF